MTPLVSLSTASTFPESTATTFEMAARLGYDGLEIMVGTDAASQDPTALLGLRDRGTITPGMPAAPDGTASSACARRWPSVATIVNPPLRNTSKAPFNVKRDSSVEIANIVLPIIDAS